jgi:hypothetical protein
MTPRLAALLAAACLLAGCDGVLSIDGRVVRPDGRPVPDATVAVTVNEAKPGGPDLAATTDADGRFHVQRVDCPCDFPVHIAAAHPQHGRATVHTTHRALQKDRNVVLTLDGTALAPAEPRP